MFNRRFTDDIDLFYFISVYRASFRQTFSEFTAKTGEWKAIVAGILFGLAATGWIVIMMKRSGKAYGIQ